MLNALVVGDPHLTMQSDDEYRWKLFEFYLPRLGRNNKIDHLIILGDLTDKKDRHESQFVNRLCKALVRLTGFFQVHIVKGNHDYSNPDYPFFNFLNMFRSDIHFYSVPYQWGKENVLFLPHTHRPLKTWRGIAQWKGDFIFMHQSVIGASTSGDYKMQEGLNRSFFDRFEDARIVSGDIHKPQRCGPVRYIGTPYPIAYNDHHRNSILRIKNGRTWKVDTTHFMSRRIFHLKYLRDLKHLDAPKGTQVKITLELPPYEIASWRHYKEEVIKKCEDRRWEVHGVEMITKQGPAKQRSNQKASAIGNDPGIQFKHYCEGENIIGTEIHGEGKNILDEAGGLV